MLKETGFQVRDLSTDLCDGVRLVALIEVLQKRKLRNVLRPVNQHQMLENTTTALNAITADGIKLVNIGTICNYCMIMISLYVKMTDKNLFLGQFVRIPSLANVLTRPATKKLPSI